MVFVFRSKLNRQILAKSLWYEIIWYGGWLESVFFIKKHSLALANSFEKLWGSFLRKSTQV